MKSPSTHLVLAAASVLMTGAGLARLGAGSTTPTGEALLPYRNAWSMAVTLTDGRVLDAGQWNDRYEVVTVDGRRIGRRTQVEDLIVTAETNPVMFANGVRSVRQTTVNEFDPLTLTAIARDVSDSLGRHSQVAFGADRIEISRTGLASRPDYHGSLATDRPVYDYTGGMYGLLLAGLPLREGLDCDLPVLRLQPGNEAAAAIGSVHVHVAGAATIATFSGKSYATLTVEVEGLKFSIAREAPYIIRLEDGTRPGQRWVFDMKPPAS